MKGNVCSHQLEPESPLRQTAVKYDPTKAKHSHRWHPWASKRRKRRVNSRWRHRAFHSLEPCVERKLLFQLSMRFTKPNYLMANEAPDSWRATVLRLLAAAAAAAAAVPPFDERVLIGSGPSCWTIWPVRPWSKKCGSFFLAAAKVVPNPKSIDTPVTPARNAAARNVSSPQRKGKKRLSLAMVACHPVTCWPLSKKYQSRLITSCCWMLHKRLGISLRPTAISFVCKYNW